MQNGQGDFGLLQLCSNDSSAIPHLVRMIKVALTTTPAQTGIGVTPRAIGLSRLSAVPSEGEAIQAVAASAGLSSQAPAEMHCGSPAASLDLANPTEPIHPVVPEGVSAVDPAV